MMDFGWINSQAQAGGLIGLKNELEVVRWAVEEKLISSGTEDTLGPRVYAHVKLISRAVPTVSASFRMGLRVLSHLFLTDYYLVSKTDEWLSRFLERVEDATPKPFFEPIASLYRQHGDDLKCDIDLRPRAYKEYVGLSTDSSICHRFCGAGAYHGVTVSCSETQQHLKLLKGHEKNVSVVKFNSDSSTIISGSLDQNVSVWEWQNTESPSLILKGHKGRITDLALSGDGSKLFSGSLDRTVKLWDISSGHTLRGFSFDAEVECVAASSKTDIFAVGLRDGHLQCMNWASKCQVQRSPRLSLDLMDWFSYAEVALGKHCP